VERKIKSGQWVNIALKKDKTGARPETARPLMLDYRIKQFSRAREIIDIGMEDGLIERQGDYFSFHDDIAQEFNTKKIHGVTRLVKLLEADEPLADFLSSCIEERTSEMESTDG
jgi:hypothetical protein